jgi:plasmid stabilization system protein ParE
MTRRVVIEAEAEKELKEAADWYNAQKWGLGRRFARDVHALMRRAAENPSRFRLVSRLTRQARLPKWHYYSVYFTVSDSPAQVTVVAVFHAKRNPQELRERLK